METPRILLIEDEESCRRMMELRLASLGGQVIAFADGKQALEHLSRDGDGFDLVVTDLEMPVVKGTEVIRWLRENPATRNVPILVISSEPEPGLACGADGALKKPCSSRELARVAKELLRNGNGGGHGQTEP